MMNHSLMINVLNILYLLNKFVKKITYKCIPFSVLNTSGV